MSSETKSKVKALIKDLERRPDWRVAPIGRNSGHRTAYPPNGGLPVISIPMSPSDSRWAKNLRAALRKHGWDGTALD